MAPSKGDRCRIPVHLVASAVSAGRPALSKHILALWSSEGQAAEVVVVVMVVGGGASGVPLVSL